MKSKRILWLSSVCVVLLVFLPGRASAQCSGERWPVKIGADADANLVNLNSTSPTSIAALTGIPVPSTLPDSARVQPNETTVWVLNATLVKYVRSFDSDYHMVISDGTRTMIAEIPDPGCVGPGSPFAVGIAHARAQFDAVFTATTTFQTANVPVQITGVGFFDHLEGQEGIAPNGIELHPIIDISFGSSFSLSSSASTLTIAAGNSSSSTITSSLSGVFNSAISLSASGLPSGATASFSPTSIAAPGSGSSMITIAVGAATQPGTYNVVVNGSGGGQTHSATINLTVSSGGGVTQQLLGNPGFENGSSSPALWTATAGVVDNSAYEAPRTGSWKAWLDGFGSAHTDTLFQQVTIPATATNANLSFWRHIDTVETTTTKANDTMKVQVRSATGTVLATLATYSNLNAAAGFTQVAFDLTAYQGQTIQIYLVGTENQSLRTSFVVDDFALNVTTSGTTADFSIAAAPSALAVTAGNSGAFTITTTISGSFNSAVSLSASGLPSGAAASFGPVSIAAPGSGSATVTIAVGTSAAAGTYSVSVNSSGGGKTHSATISLTVNAGSGGTTQQLLSNPGFENGLSNPVWIFSPAVIDNGAVQAPHTGSWKAWLNGFGSVHTDTLLQQVSIPATATSASLSFWRHIGTAESTTTVVYDTLKVQIRNSSGTVLTTLATYSNLNAGAGYAQVSFDLSAYKGQTIQLYLVGTEDSSLATSFVVDDFVLNVTTP
jgi:hypothetical protein